MCDRPFCVSVGGVERISCLSEEDEGDR